MAEIIRLDLKFPSFNTSQVTTNSAVCFESEYGFLDTSSQGLQMIGDGIHEEIKEN